MTSTTSHISHVQEAVHAVYEKYKKEVRDGEAATYIPELAKVRPDDFGICLATGDGQI